MNERRLRVGFTRHLKKGLREINSCKVARRSQRFYRGDIVSRPTTKIQHARSCSYVFFAKCFYLLHVWCKICKLLSIFLTIFIVGTNRFLGLIPLHFFHRLKFFYKVGFTLPCINSEEKYYKLSGPKAPALSPPFLLTPFDLDVHLLAGV